MIREPLVLSFKNKNHREQIDAYYVRTGNMTCFYEQHLSNDKIYFGLVGIEHKDDIWNYSKTSKVCFYHDQKMTIEQLFDQLKVNYPDEFEWFIWNSERL